MPRKFDLMSLELFAAVCECRSITRAAELHHITASAVSKRVTQLEQLTGTSLLLRTHSGVSPTNDGTRLFEHARTVLSGVEAIEREMGRRGNSLRGFIRLFANRSAVGEFVPASVASFLSNPRYRNIDVQIGEMTSHEVISGVKSGLATLGVCWAEADLEGLDWRPSRRGRLSVVVPADHRLADLEGLDWRPSRRGRLSAVVPADHRLADRAGVSFAETLDYEHVGIHSGGPVTNRLRRESVRARKLLRYRVVAPTFDAMIRFIEAGLVIAIMPSEVAFRFARGSAICVIPLTDAWKERQFAVCCRSKRALPGPAADLFRHLVADSEPAEA